jgi:hypothetical protein
VKQTFGAYFFVKDMSTNDPELMGLYRRRCKEEAEELSRKQPVDLSSLRILVSKHQEQFRWEFIDDEYVPVESLGYFDSVGWTVMEG